MFAFSEYEYGECLALQVDDVDFENNILHIRRTTTLNKEGKVVLGPCTKTPSGERKIIITELIKPVLEDAIRNKKTSELNLLFCKDDGGLYSDSALNSSLKRLSKKAGIECRVHNHKLRKNFNTRGVEAGIDYKVLEENAGHSDIHILMDTYVDAHDDFKETEICRISKKN